MVDELINISIAYSNESQHVYYVEMQLTFGISVLQAAYYAKLDVLFPDLDLENADFGIFSYRVDKNNILQAGDRIEIYRPLIADPKMARRQRAEKAKEEGRANKITGGRA